MTEGTFNPAKRRLCPDGACVGVVGDDGRCRVCGLAGDGAVVWSGSATPAGAFGAGDGGDADSDSDAGFSSAPSNGDAVVEQAQLAAGAGGFHPGRRLCDDGSCVGVIGSSGVCSVCGRASGS